MLPGGVVEELLNLVLAHRAVFLLPGQHPGLLKPFQAAGEDAAVEAVLPDEQTVLGGQPRPGLRVPDLAPATSAMSSSYTSCSQRSVFWKNVRRQKQKR